MRIDKWWEPDAVARRRVAGSEIVIIRSYKRGNGVKAKLLLAAAGCEVGAILALAASVVIVVSKG